MSMKSLVGIDCPKVLMRASIPYFLWRIKRVRPLNPSLTRLALPDIPGHCIIPCLPFQSLIKPI